MVKSIHYCERVSINDTEFQLMVKVSLNGK